MGENFWPRLRWTRRGPVPAGMVLEDDAQAAGQPWYGVAWQHGEDDAPNVVSDLTAEPEAREELARRRGGMASPATARRYSLVEVRKVPA